jgi:hypothetical protein
VKFWLLNCESLAESENRSVNILWLNWQSILEIRTLLMLLLNCKKIVELLKLQSQNIATELQKFSEIRRAKSFKKPKKKKNSHQQGFCDSGVTVFILSGILYFCVQ